MYLLYVAAALVVGSVGWLLWTVASARTPATATGNLQRGGIGDLRELVLARSATERTFRPMLGSLARIGRRLTPSGMVDALSHRLRLAGQPWSLERVLSMKILLAGSGALFGLLRMAAQPEGLTVLAAVGLTGTGYLLPDILLHQRAQRRQDEIRLRLPDTLDQMTVCVQAGLGFEAAMARTARTGTGALAEELARTVQEMHVGSSRAQALRALVERTDAPEMRRFVFALLQAEEYGLPMAQVLKAQAAELRVRRRQQAEERALKIPVKLVFPLITCVLPSLFVVVLGPAAMRLMDFFHTSV